jgi:MOSC domain-containing protein YiiM
VETTKGKIKAISISKEKGTKKYNVPTAQLKADFGMEGDAHAGNWHRQVSLLAEESIAKMRAKGATVTSGDFAENITTEGIDLQSLTIGSKLRLALKLKLRSSVKNVTAAVQSFNKSEIALCREKVFLQK